MGVKLRTQNIAENPENKIAEQSWGETLKMCGEVFAMVGYHIRGPMPPDQPVYCKISLVVVPGSPVIASVRQGGRFSGRKRMPDYAHSPPPSYSPCLGWWMVRPQWQKNRLRIKVRSHKMPLAGPPIIFLEFAQKHPEGIGTLYNNKSQPRALSLHHIIFPIPSSLSVHGGFLFADSSATQNQSNETKRTEKGKNLNRSVLNQIHSPPPQQLWMKSLRKIPLQAAVHGEGPGSPGNKRLALSRLITGLPYRREEVKVFKKNPHLRFGTIGIWTMLRSRSATWWWGQISSKTVEFGEIIVKFNIQIKNRIYI